MSDLAARPVDIRSLTMPVTLIGSGLLVIFGGLHYLDARFERVDAAIQMMTNSQNAIRLDVERIKLLLDDRWSVTMQKMWELEMRRLNPTVQFPDAYRIANHEAQVELK